MSCKENKLTLKDKYEKNEKVTVMQQENNIHKTKSLVQKEKDVCAQEEISEGDKVLQQLEGDLEDMFQTEESDYLGACLDLYLKPWWGRTAPFSQTEQLTEPMSCKDDNLTFEDVSIKDKAERAEKVPVMPQKDTTQEPDSLVQKENDVGTQEELKISEGDNVLQ